MYDYTYSYSSGDASVNVALGSMVLILLVIALIFYIFESAGLYTLAKRRGIHYPGLAWVPVARDWVMGSLSDQYAMRLGQNKSYRKVLPALGAVVTILAVLVLSFTIQFIVRLVTGDRILYAQLYQASNNPEEAVLLVFGSIMPFSPFCISWALSIWCFILLRCINSSIVPSRQCRGVFAAEHFPQLLAPVPDFCLPQ